MFQKRYYYELENKISPEKLKEIVANTNFYQIPGLALFYSELVQGIPPIFKHYIENVPAVHSILIFVSIKSLPINKVPVKEHFLFRRVEPRELNVFRYVVRYGYIDVQNDSEPFEKVLIERLKEFISDDFRLSKRVLSNAKKEGDVLDGWLENGKSGSGDVREFEEDKGQEVIEKEIEAVAKAWHAGIVHLMGETEVVASEGASMGKRIMRNLRESKEVVDIPHERMLKVGMTYEL